MPPKEHPLFTDTEAQKLCSHVSSCSQAPHHHQDTISLLHSRNVHKERDYYLERRWHKHPNSPPKAIVTPLKSHAVDTSKHLPCKSTNSHDFVCSTCLSHSRTLASAEAVCDLKSNTQTKKTIDGWKNLLEAKDKMLAQKNDLIER